jgi:hypothetical protein
LDTILTLFLSTETGLFKDLCVTRHENQFLALSAAFLPPFRRDGFSNMKARVGSFDQKMSVSQKPVGKVRRAVLLSPPEYEESGE